MSLALLLAPVSSRGSVRALRAVTSALLAAAALAVESPARADGGAGSGGWQFEWLVTVHRFINDEPRADPDQASLRYGLHGLRWKAMAGDGIVLAAVTSDTLRLGLALHGFIELVNFNTGYPVPWESYRANVGMELLAESPRLNRALLPRGGQLQLSVGWFHESDHVANLNAYIADYVRSSPYTFATALSSFNNGEFSSYEQVKLRAVYRQPLWAGRLTAMTALGTRLFPKPIAPHSVRAMHAAVLAEGRLTLRITSAVRPFVSTYFELVGNGFRAQAQGFNYGADAQPLRYAILNLGVDLVGKGGTMVSPFFTYSRSHGRGVDFPRFFGPEAGFGLAVLP